MSSGSREPALRGIGERGFGQILLISNEQKRYLLMIHMASGHGPRSGAYGNYATSCIGILHGLRPIAYGQLYFMQRQKKGARLQRDIH